MTAITSHICLYLVIFWQISTSGLPQFSNLKIPYFFKTFSRLKFVFFKTTSLRDKRKITVIRGLFSSPCMFNTYTLRMFNVKFWIPIGEGWYMVLFLLSRINSSNPVLYDCHNTYEINQIVIQGRNNDAAAKSLVSTLYTLKNIGWKNCHDFHYNQ